MSFADDDARDDPETGVVDGDAVELPSHPAADAAQSPASASATPVYEPEPYAARAYASTSAPAGPAGSASSRSDAGIDLAERPEILVGAAFGGGLLLALILRRLGR